MPRVPRQMHQFIGRSIPSQLYYLTIRTCTAAGRSFYEFRVSGCIEFNKITPSKMKKVTSYFSHTNNRARTSEDTPEHIETGTGNESLSSHCEAASSS
jgi:hypothetical protein